MANDGREEVSAEPDERAEVTVSSLRTDLPAAVRSRGRFWYRVVGGGVLVALVLAGTLVWLRPTLPVGALTATQTARPSDPLLVDASSARIRCLYSAAWSPDSASFVLDGNSSCISAKSVQDETLVIFDARTGAVRARTIVHATDIQRALPPPAGASWTGTRIRYGQPFWSPDGRRVVMTFEADAAGANETPGGSTTARDGIVMLDNRLGAMRIFGGLSGTTPLLSGPGSFFGPQTIEQWDLSAGTAALVTLPMGLTYSWGAGDRLSASNVVAQSPVAPPPSVSPGPPGNPVGGRTFTLWQEGDVNFADGTDCSGIPSAAAPNYYLTFLNTSAWSPDGRYLALYVSANGRPALTPPAPPTPGLSTSLSCTNFGAASDWPQLPIHDAGMRAALALIDGTNLQSIQLTWSPDGKHLAVAPSEVGAGALALTVYDCASGRVLRQFSAAEIVPVQSGGRPFSTMAWSPDGTRLLLVPQGPAPVIRVLGPKSLGS